MLCRTNYNFGAAAVEVAHLEKRRDSEEATPSRCQSGFE
jgi:hypothetical protein